MSQLIGKRAKCLFFDRAEDDLAAHLKGQYTQSFVTLDLMK